MKKFTLLISLLLISLFSIQLSAQNTTKTTTEHEYIPLVVENAQWVVSLYEVAAMEYYAVYGYKIQGDTIINATNYKKVYWRDVGFSGATTIVGQPLLFGAIREDVESKQIYGISFSDDYGNARCMFTYWGFEENCPLDEEVLMYDFSLIDGDNFGSLCSIEYNEAEITHANDQFLYGEWRFTQEVVPITMITVEGIGSINGLFESIYGELSGWYHNIEGYCVGTDTECGFQVASNLDLQLFSQILVNPNPATNTLKITNDSSTKIHCVKVYNALGKLVFNKAANFYQIDIEPLSIGIYTLQIQTENMILNKKFIKE